MKQKRRKRYKVKKRGCLLRLFGLVLCLTVGFCVFRMVSTPKVYEEAELMEMGIPKSLNELYQRNEEARDFVLGYSPEKREPGRIDITKDVKAGKIPLFLQWDERWGYVQYGDDFMALEGCGPTCLSMVYTGLTGDTSMNPLAMAELSEKGNHYVSGIGTSWSLMQDMAAELGLQVDEVFFMADSIVEELQAGHPIICAVGPGDFTTMGHFIVLTDVDDDGMVTVHDPNSPKNSKQKWDVETIMSQTENLWSYRY